jgi:ketosteroid isomerase-like protein
VAGEPTEAETGKVELVRALYEAWNEGVAVEALVDRFFSTEVEWHDQPELPGATVHHGRREVARMLNGLLAMLGRFEVDVERIEDLGDHLALGLFVLRGVGQTSGIAVTSRTVHLLSIAGGQIRRVRAFITLEPIVEPLRGRRG